MTTAAISPRLYDIPKELEALVFEYESLLQETMGEVTPEVNALEAKIAEYIQAGTDKIEAAAMAVKNLKADATKAKDESKRLSSRASAFENNANRLLLLIGTALDAVGGKVKTARFTVYNKANPISYSLSLAHDCNLLKLHELYPQFVKVEADLRKSDLVAAYKSGTEIPAEITITQNQATSHVEIR